MRAIAIDANLVLLWVVGTVDRDWIGRHKRLKALEAADFDLLIDILQPFDSVTTIPNALTEASNLVVYGVDEPLRTHFRRRLAQVAKVTREVYVKSEDAVDATEFARLGLTDAAWLIALDRETTLLTLDLGLFLAACERGLMAQNFNHLRAERFV